MRGDVFPGGKGVFVWIDKTGCMMLTIPTSSVSLLDMEGVPDI